MKRDLWPALAWGALAGLFAFVNLSMGYRVGYSEGHVAGSDFAREQQSAAWDEMFAELKRLNERLWQRQAAAEPNPK